MDSTVIDISRLNSYDLSKVVQWYRQEDKSWIYCDSPLSLNYSYVYDYIKSQLDTSFDDLEDPNRVMYYSIEHIFQDSYRQIGFAIIRKKFDYFEDVSGYSIGLDIPEKCSRYSGFGTIAIRRLLHILGTFKNNGLHEIYLETLSYNKPMQKVAEKLGFELIEQRKLGEEYQSGFASHIKEIADCLNTEVEKLTEEKVCAMLYRINLSKDRINIQKGMNMRKIKWGVLGTAMICERDTIPGMLLADNVELYAIAGRNKDKADRFKNQYGFRKAYYDYECLLDDPEVEAVYIPLPNTMHCEWTIKALNMHKHVLCEKPLATNAEEAEKMFAAARANDVYLMEAFAYKDSPYMAALRDDIKSGVIGRINFVSSKFLTSSYNDDNIRMRRETCGGSLYDLGVYSLSFIQSMLCEVPESCKAIAEFSDDNIDLLTHAILKYQSGITADVISGMVLEKEKNRWQCEFAIDGSAGTIKSEEFIFNGRGRQSYVIIDSEGRETQRVIDAPHNYMLEVEQLGNCIINGERPKVTEEFSINNAKMVDMILREMEY